MCHFKILATYKSTIHHGIYIMTKKNLLLLPPEVQIIRILKIDRKLQEPLPQSFEEA